MWRSRLRWRVRGAWQWPAFAVGLAVDAVLLELLPVSGSRGPGGFAALLLAGVLQLVVVAALARPAGRLLRRWRPSLPRVMADDRAGTALLAALALALLAAGLVHRPAGRAGRADFAAQAQRARAFVLGHAPAPFRANVDRMDTWQQGPDLYRTCVPGADPHRAYCLLLFTDQRPVGVARDQDRRPNAIVAGPDNPGRRSG